MEIAFAISCWTPRELRDLNSKGLQPKSKLGWCRKRETASNRGVFARVESKRPHVAVVGAGWAGLGAAWTLAKQGDCDVTLLDSAPNIGGLVAGWKTKKGQSVEVGVHGFWRRYYNIFNLLYRELGLRNAFTPWTRSSQRSPKGKVVESPIFGDLPYLPTPMGTFVYTKFLDLPLIDRLSALPLLNAVIEWDSSDEAWKKYDQMTARELFRMYGCSERVYKEAFEPMLLVGLFAPGEQCSAAGALGMLSYFILHSTPAFDVKWPRGTVASVIFTPWIESLRQLGVKVETGTRLTDVIFSESNQNFVESISISTAGSNEPSKNVDVDAVIFAVGISGMQGIVRSSKSLASKAQFRNTLNLSAIDVVAVRIYLDRHVDIEFASNACFGFPEHSSGTGWTYFNLNDIHDEFRDCPRTVLECDFYHGNQYLAMSDEDVIAEVKRMLDIAEPSFANAVVDDYTVVRIPRGVTHFRSGSYQDFLSGKTEVMNVFAAGDWIKGSSHASFSQEKAYVTGIEAANLAMTHLGFGEECHGKIIPLEPDESHIHAARTVQKELKRIVSRLPGSDFFIP